MTFKDKLVGFVDILGFKSLVESAESAARTGDSEALNRLLDLTSKLGTLEAKQQLAKYGPSICPESSYIQKDLDFELTQISDCVIVSAEVSPAGIVNLVSHCFRAVIELLQRGIMCRGYITRGSVYHSQSQILGSAYQNAYRQESQVAAFKREADERGTPFVEVDRAVAEYVNSSGDQCVKEMFGRMVKDDGECVAIFPFQRFGHSFIIDRNTNAAEELQSNNNIRLWIRRLKEQVSSMVDAANADAVRKSQHYLRALDEQLAVCDRTDDFIRRFL